MNISQVVNVQSQQSFQGFKVQGGVQVVPLHFVGLKGGHNDLFHVIFADVTLSHQRRLDATEDPVTVAVCVPNKLVHGADPPKPCLV